MLLLNGRWVAPGEPIDVINPANGEAFARVATVDREGVHRALADAQAAWEPWRRLTGKQRGTYLRKIADGVELRDLSKPGAPTRAIENLTIRVSHSALSGSARWLAVGHKHHPWLEIIHASVLVLFFTLLK